jgi:hypothetical protein
VTAEGAVSRAARSSPPTIAPTPEEPSHRLAQAELFSQLGDMTDPMPGSAGPSSFPASQQVVVDPATLKVLVDQLLSGLCSVFQTAGVQPTGHPPSTQVAPVSNPLPATLEQFPPFVAVQSLVSPAFSISFREEWPAAARVTWNSITVDGT